MIHDILLLCLVLCLVKAMFLELQTAGIGIHTHHAVDGNVDSVRNS